MGFVRHLKGDTAARGAERAGEVQSAQATDNAAQLAQVGVENQARLQGAQTNQLAELRSGAYGANNILGQAGQEAMAGIGQAGQEAGGLFDPFAQLGQQGVDQAGFLTDPNAQFDFLQNNPLFQMGLDNANTQTNQMAAARGRLSAGDTLQQLNQNALLTASPLIQQQKQAIQNQLTMGQNAANQQASIGQNAALNQANIGQNTAANQANITNTLGGQRADVFGNTAINQSNLAAGNQANVGNLLGSAAAAQAAGIVGRANAKGAGAANILNVGAQMAGAFMGTGAQVGSASTPPPSMPGGGGFGSNLNLSSQPLFDSSAWGTYPGGT